MELEPKDYFFLLLILGLYAIGIVNAVLGILRQRINLLIFVLEGKSAVFMGVFALALLLFATYPLIVGTLLVRFGPEEYRVIPQEDFVADDFSTQDTIVEATHNESQLPKEERSIQEEVSPEVEPPTQELSVRDWKTYENELYVLRFPANLASEEYRAPFTGKPKFLLGQEKVFSISVSIEDKLANDGELQEILEGGCGEQVCPLSQVTVGENTFWTTNPSNPGHERPTTVFALLEPQTSYSIFVTASTAELSENLTVLINEIISTIQFKDLGKILAAREASQEELNACVVADSDQARDCYTALAYNKNNPAICNLMPGETSAEQGNRGFCLGFMAIVTADLGICRDQSDQYYQNVCESAYRRYYMELDQTFINSIERTREQYSNAKTDP